MPDDVDDDLLVLLSDVARHIGTYGDRLAKAHGITRAQLIVLTRLGREPDLSQCELAAMAEVSAMTIARLIDRLEALGLVERCADPADRRIWRLRLAPKAAPLQLDIGRLRAKLLAVTTDGIEPAVVRAMALGLRQMKENVIARCSSDAHARRQSMKGKPAMHRGTLADLTTSIAVADSRSFRGAGERLGITPSALSHSMKQLEQRVGTRRLLNRTTRSSRGASRSGTLPSK